MPRQRTDTRAEIRETALELFAEKGYTATSLREIAEGLGITKAALYYHFRSKQDLLADMIRPMIDDGERTVRELEEEPGVTARHVLEAFYDTVRRHGALFQAVIADTAALGDLGDVVPKLFDWRERLLRLIFGADPTERQRALAVLAVGGLQDAAVMAGDELGPDGSGDGVDLRSVVVEGALRALDLPAS
ncbi:helix-turn-helix domain containing protein [Nocardiopsis sp. RSe5-2]|uniref:Helix-turn-helix domain containing protein n=1 Tax=Nocardiopsis endophytica TaxID=3018445 RepID=A0ABT4U2S6_9ACTN|nr:TetR/AcrR family transcriptional regulator [Nocardiopsis endophytica]MDA2811252.1 helix-turn-helix domain containing protein [Nocardiopsis endophytica]